jgi:hypothetical protein
MINREYLNSLENKDSASFADAFDNKLTKIKELYSKSPDSVTRGFGNYNSKIVFVFNDSENYRNEISAIELILKKFNVNIYDLYVMFRNNNDAMMIEEFNIISPVFAYVFFNTNVQFNVKTLFVNNLQSHLNDGPYIFDRFKHLVTYNI